jgi:uncharacterized protein YxjI
MALFHVKGVWGLISGSYEITDESGVLKYRLVYGWWHGWSLRIRDGNNRHLGDIGLSLSLFWPSVIRYDGLGTARLKKNGFWRSEYTLTVPDGTALRVRCPFRKVVVFRGEQEIATATKKFWSFDHIYRVEFSEGEHVDFILVTVAILGNFSGGSSSS